MDRLQEMSSFVAVVEAGSFSGAEDATSLSKAALSRHVAALEQRLGIRLLHRTTRRLSLTEEGQRFYARAQELLQAFEDVESEVSSQRAEVAGTLRVNAPLTFGILHLAPLWGKFASRHPKVSLDVTLSDRVVDLVDEGYDLAVRIAIQIDSQLVTRKLATTRMVCCASRQYLDKHGEPTSPRDLARHRIVAYSYWTTHDEWKFAGPHGEAIVRTSPFMHTNNGDTCRVAALHGEGVILQPDFLVGEDLKRGDLVELMPQYASIEIGIYAVYASRKHLPTKTRSLIDFLVDSFKSPSWHRSSD
jgi:DNA-binding transcriptional LysR family regulator